MGDVRAFVILQIGSPHLDRVYELAIAPAIRACGLEPRRVDRDNRGGLLHSEIVELIEDARILVADLTNERPNCYLEVGYALGARRSAHLVLTAREDHQPESPHYRSGGPRVHFDLSGYDILFWDPGRLDQFRAELAKRIRRRLELLDQTM